MLRNPAYKGEWHYGKRSRKKQLIKGRCPALVDDPIFVLAQARLRENNMWADRTHRRPYLLRGLIKCGLCGHSFTGYYSRIANNGEARYYRCNRNGNRGSLLSARCYAPTIRGDIVEDLVWQQICDFIQNPKVVRDSLKNKFDVCHAVEYIAELAQSRHRLEELKEAERRLLVKYADPAADFSEEALNGALTEIRASKRTVQSRIQELEDAVTNEDEQRHKLQDVNDILSILQERIKEATFETKRQIFELLVREIRVGKSEDGITTLNIVYLFSKEGIETDSNVQLCSARMPLRLLRRPVQGVYLPAQSDFPLSEAY